MRPTGKDFWAALLTAAIAAVLAPPARGRDAAADARVLQAAHVPTDPAALFDFVRQQIPTDKDRAAIDKLIARFGNASFASREKACKEALALGPKVVYRLRQALTDADPEVQSRAKSCLQNIERQAHTRVALAALRCLKDKAPSGTVPLLLNYLPFADDQAAADEALAALAGVAADEKDATIALTAALHDRLPARRAAAAFVLGREPSRRQLVRPLLTDAETDVRIRAAQGLIAGGDLTVTLTLIAWLEQGTPDLVERAQDVLGWLAGENTPATPPAETDPGRHKCHDLWADWWQDNNQTARTHPADRDALIDLQALRARRITQQFVSALIQREDATATALLGAPFLYKFTRHDSVQELGRVLRRLRAEYRTLRGDNSPRVTSVRYAAEYADSAVPSERDFLRGFPIQRVRVVMLAVPDHGHTSERIFFVYLAEGYPRIVGYGNG